MSSIVNINELYNVVTSATGVGSDNATLQTNIQNLQKMVLFDSKTILANTIAKYDTSPITVRDPVSFLNSVKVSGSITQNGTALRGVPAGATTEIQYNSAGAFAGSPNLTFDGTSLVNPSLKAPSETLQTLTSTAATLAIDTGVANAINLLLTTPVTSLSFTGASLTGLYTMRLLINQDAIGARTVTWPLSVKWGTAGPPLLSTDPLKTDIIELITPDAGLNWFGRLIGLGF
jgi:hypothetical protein